MGSSAVSMPTNLLSGHAVTWLRRRFSRRRTGRKGPNKHDTPPRGGAVQDVSTWTEFRHRSALAWEAAGHGADYGAAPHPRAVRGAGCARGDRGPDDRGPT